MRNNEERLTALMAMLEAGLTTQPSPIDVNGSPTNKVIQQEDGRTSLDDDKKEEEDCLICEEGIKVGDWSVYCKQGCKQRFHASCIDT